MHGSCPAGRGALPRWKTAAARRPPAPNGARRARVPAASCPGSGRSRNPQRPIASAISRGFPHHLDELRIQTCAPSDSACSGFGCTVLARAGHRGHHVAVSRSRGTGVGDDRRWDSPCTTATAARSNTSCGSRSRRCARRARRRWTLDFLGEDVFRGIRSTPWMVAANPCLSNTGFPARPTRLSSV